MKKVGILVVVDADAALASGSLVSNAYMIDTNHWIGSWNEGTSDLHTICQDQQLLSWQVISVSPDNSVEIVGFNGVMFDNKICMPTKQGIGSDIYWEGRVQSRGAGGRYDYGIQVVVDNKAFVVSAYLDVR